MKRFTETCKWDDPWFRSLTGIQKLIFLYVLDRCNNAGFWERDDDAVAYHTKLKPDLLEGAWKGLDRGLIGASGWVWVRRFLRHQKNESLNPVNPAHKQIIGLISEQVSRFEGSEEFRAFVAPYMGLLSPIGIGLVKVQDKVPDRKGSAEGKPESRETALAFALEIGMTEEDFAGWFDHFESNGWRVSGKSPMKDWRAALRNGKRRAKDFGPGRSAKHHETAAERDERITGLKPQTFNLKVL